MSDTHSVVSNNLKHAFNSSWLIVPSYLGSISLNGESNVSPMTTETIAINISTPTSPSPEPTTTEATDVSHRIDFTLSMYEQLVALYEELEQKDEVTEHLIFGRAKVSKDCLLDFDSHESVSFLDQYIGRLIMARETRMLGRSLCMAAALGDTLLMQAFLKAKVDKAFQDSSACLEDWPNEGQFTHLLPPLMSAALAGREEAVALLLDAGLNVNSIDIATSMSALHVVGYQGLGEMVRYLVSRGADLNLVDRHGRTPLHCAVYGDCRRGGRRELNGSSTRALLSEGAEVNAVSKDGSTPLHIAVYTYQVEATRLLLQYGASIGAKRADGKTVLDFLYRRSVKAGHWGIDQGEIFSILLHHGAFKESVEGSTPLHNVVKFQKYRYVRFMLGLDPLHTDIATFGGDKTIDQGPDLETEFPELASCDVDSRDHAGKTPLHLATMEHRSEIVEALLQAGANPRLAEPNGSTPLHNIMKEGGGLAECTKALLEKGAEVNARDNEQNTPLHFAAKLTEHGLQQMLSAAEDVQLRDGLVELEEDHPLATLSARLQYFKVPLLESWDLLLAWKADINAVNNQSQTPLHIAVENRNWTLIAKLLKAGASRDLADANGRKSVEIAKQNKDHKAEKLFGLDLAGLEEVIVTRTGDTERPRADPYY